MKPAALSRSNRYLGLFFVAFAIFLILVWAPLDSGSGLIEKVRRQVVIGDALAPALAGALILLGGVLVFLQPHDAYADGVSLRNLAFLVLLLAIVACSFSLMRWAGPLAVAIVDFLLSENIGYRPRRDMIPWKYIGFILGGMTMIVTFISGVEGRVTLRAIVLALLTVAGLIAVFDLPFDDLVLPPNGDV